jgi:hypothetical protein
LYPSKSRKSVVSGVDRFAFSVDGYIVFLGEEIPKIRPIISAFPNLEITKARRLVAKWFLADGLRR